ncbi:Laminin alpha-like [Oopsacas minuta]|uniref:Laminin alpha-like n=1 Tax=Oopsacas minuta TaxID=111878 RepID=A0AAV7JP30_9METZ|nr:Laminin alpha-like [Oopsacas minuta]
MRGKLILLFLFLISLLSPSLSNELSPPLFTFDESSGAIVTASSTCGDPPSQYLPPNSNLSVLCNSSDTSESYPATNLLDSTTNRWQSENTVSPVSITISLPDNQIFEIYLLIIYFYTQLPTSLLIEVSRDAGATYIPWQYYVDPNHACQAQFGENVTTRFTPYDDDVINPRAFCTIYPDLTMDGDISQLIWGPLFTRDEINNARLDFIRVSNIRITMNGFNSLLSVSEQQYYSLSQVSIRGRCVCHGHASQCDDTNSPYQCACEHNTAGNQCDVCEPLYNQIPWMQSLTAVTSRCEPCNCMQHASSCVYNQMAEGQSIDIAGNLFGGGVCQNCEHNTMGYNCELCITDTYRDPFLPDTDNLTCKSCDCYLPGTIDNNPDCVRNQAVAISPASPGDCFCLVGVGGSKCDQCSPDFYNTSSSNDRLTCTECACSNVGSITGTRCDDVTGQCVCKENIGDRTCQECLDEFHTFSPQGCVACSCDIGGSLSLVCNKSSGICPCKPGIQNQLCTEVVSSFFLPSLHYVQSQAEDGVDADFKQLPRAASLTEFPGFLGQGYAVAGSGTAQTFLISINVTRATTYRLVLRYLSATIGFISFTFSSVILGNFDTQGVFSLSSLNSTTYIEAHIVGSNTPLEIFIPEPGEYRLNATRSEIVLVDLLTMIPAVFYDPGSVLGGNAQRFTDECNVTSNSLTTSFCIQAGFTLASFEQSAIPCECTSHLSISSVCQTLGGQCSCKPGVTGRECDRCILGYYFNGVDACIPCGCQGGAICDLNTGQCPCSTGMTGRQCDECDVMFYQNSTAIGPFECLPCDCVSPGSVNGICNKTTGECECRDNVRGRTCDQCSPDHWGLGSTGCQICGCDMTGSEVTQCDLTSGQCSCKQLTEGMTCNQCTAGSFLLSSTTPTGCTQCYCSYLNTDCTALSGSYQDIPLPLSSINWDVVSISNAGDIISENVTTTRNTDSIFVSSVSSPPSPLFLAYPLSDLDVNLLLSYGGYIRLSLNSSIGDSTPGLFLYHNTQIIGLEYSDPLEANSLTSYFSPLLEFAWTTQSGSAVSRSDFIDILVSLPLLLIRIGEGTDYTAVLSAVSLQRASLLTDIADPLPIERCQCPIEYSGLSCQKCATGYYRDITGLCVACECNGHSMACDPDNGTCINCQDNTDGNRCQNCIDTYFGDATQGSHQDCNPCPCSPYTATNLSCYPDTQGDAMCSCLEGHTGRLCSVCDGLNNYHGDPISFPNTSCSQCTCSGNIDFSVPNSCNTTTGQCTRCINNSTGSSCHLCLPGYFGDATTQSCEPCLCNNTGSTTMLCNTTTGQCSCIDNVEGRQCNTCMPYFYNFTSLGCDPCLCDGIGSTHSQCLQTTGQCSCKAGVTGQQCQLCTPGYYNFSDIGCSACQCGIGATNTSCDQRDGYCYCQPGVAGDKCNECIPFYENIMSSGCSRCDACTEQLGREAMLIQDTEFDEVAIKLSNLITLSTDGETHLTSHQTSYTPVSLIVGGYSNTLNEYESRIRSINVSALNNSAQTVADSHSDIVDDIALLSPNIDNEFTRIRNISLNVEMVLAYLELMQLEVLPLVLYLEDYVTSVSLALHTVNQTLSTAAQLNYSVNLTQALNTLSLVRIEFNRSNTVSMQLNAQKAQISNLTSIANSLASLLQSVSVSLNNLHSRNNESAILIATTGSVLYNADFSVSSFDNILYNLLAQLIEIRTLINYSIETRVSSNEYYSIAINTLNGTTEQGYNLEAGDTYISKDISNLRILQANLGDLIVRVETHQLELIANTTLIETYYDETHPLAIEAFEAITNYSEVIRLISEACITANESLLVAAAALEESIKLMQLGVVGQVELGLNIARNLLNISFELETKITNFTTVEYAALLVSINLTRYINYEVGNALNSTSSDLDSIQDRVFSFSSQINQILDKLPDLQFCIYLNASSAVSTLSEFRENTTLLVIRIVNCSVRISEYDALGQTANALLNTTANALMQRVYAISDSVVISDANIAKLQAIDSIVERIESIRDTAFDAIAKLKIALALRANSSLTYPPLPANVPLQYTQVSIFFMSTVTSGMLFFIQTSSGNSVSLQLQNGTLIFSFDVGIDFANVSIGGIMINKWYQVLATRDTRQLTMSLSSQEIDNIQTSRVKGSIDSILSLLFLPTDTIYLGHTPADTSGSEVENFEGCVEDLVFNHMPIPLFDPIDRSEDLTSCGMRAVTRSYIPGIWFFGGGYLILELNEVLLDTPGSSLSISFRTLSDGIILLSSNVDQSSDITLHITQNRVRLDIMINGNISNSIQSTQYVTDNINHVVYIRREGAMINFQVNQQSIDILLLPEGFSLGSALSIGGITGSAVSDSFSGVINELMVDEIIVDLRDSTNKFRTAPLSPSDVTPGRYHTGTGYAQFPLTSSTISLLSIRFSFSTTSLTGLLLLMFANDSGSSPIHLTMEHGSLTFTFMFLTSTTRRQGVIILGQGLNDGNFHSVKIEFLSDQVRVIVDNISSSTEDCFGEVFDCGSDILVATPLYVGGVPDSARLSIPVVSSYKGCIRDLVVNDIVYDYYNADILSGVNLYGCVPAPEQPTPTPTPTPTPSSTVIPTSTVIHTSSSYLFTSIQETSSSIMSSITSSIFTSISSVFTRSLSSTDVPVQSSVSITFTPSPGPSSSISLSTSTIPTSSISTSLPSSPMVTSTMSISTMLSSLSSTPDFTTTTVSSSIPQSSILLSSLSSTPDFTTTTVSSSIPQSSILLSSLSSTPDFTTTTVSSSIPQSSILLSSLSSTPDFTTTTTVSSSIPQSSILLSSLSSTPDFTTTTVSSSIPQSSILLSSLSSTPDFTTTTVSSSIPQSSILLSSIISSTQISSPPITTRTTIPTSSISTSTPIVTPTVTPFNACQTIPPASLLRPHSAGSRFDSYNNSYVLLDISPSELAIDTVFRIELSSIAYHGIIFFVNGLNNFDFIELRFYEGRLQFSFSLGSNPTRVTTTNRYDDGVRYRVEATRLGPIGLLSVLEIVGQDNYMPREYVRTPIHDAAFFRFDLSNNFYFGGRPDQQVSADMCVTSLLINSLERLLTSGIQYKVNRCYSRISRGATLFGSGSYIQLYSSYQVDRNLTVQLEFRTFNHTSLLFYVANSEAGDHVTVELRDGSLVYTVDNGAIGNPNRIVYTPSSRYYLCNGLWHSVSFTKHDNYITITVDGEFMDNSIVDNLTAVDTRNYPLFIGGIDPDIIPRSHVTTQSFKGCVREIFLNNEYISINSIGVVTNDVELAGCIL